MMLNQVPLLIVFPDSLHVEVARISSYLTMVAFLQLQRARRSLQIDRWESTLEKAPLVWRDVGAFDRKCKPLYKKG